MKPTREEKKIFFFTIWTRNWQRTERVGRAEDKLLPIRSQLPGGLHLMLRYRRDITTISRCSPRRLAPAEGKLLRKDQLFMCACVPLVWLTQPAALSQGCGGRAGDLHPPLGQICLLLPWKKTWKWGKAIDAVGCAAASAAGVWCVFRFCPSLGTLRRYRMVYLDEGRSTEPQRFTPRFDVTSAFPNANSQKEKKASTPRNCSKETIIMLSCNYLFERSARNFSSSPVGCWDS